MGARPLMPSTMTLAILAVAVAGMGLVFASEGYTHFILALVALTAIVGVGLNVLLGLSGQVSLGHVGFYAIGAYTASILTVNGISFWLAFPAAHAQMYCWIPLAGLPRSSRHFPDPWPTMVVVVLDIWFSCDLLGHPIERRVLANSNERPVPIGSGAHS